MGWIRAENQHVPLFEAIVRAAAALSLVPRPLELLRPVEERFGDEVRALEKIGASDD